MSQDMRVRLDALAAYLVGAGVLDGPAGRMWLDGLHAVPRHLFVPPRAWAEPMDDRAEHVIDRDAGPDLWWDAVYSNTAIITQRGDGEADMADTSRPASSSLSCPHVAMEFLCLLDVDDHHRVLEIGTGTGWTAAMLAWRLSGEQVVTVEVDKAVAGRAEANLLAAGLAPAVIVGDGVDGHAAGAPYDRVHVTCGVRDVPYAWVEQTRPGGVIALPYMPPHGRAGEQLRLDVLDDGTAHGRFRGGCGFMMIRSQRRPGRWPAYSGDGVASTTRFDPRTACQALPHGFGLYLASALPHLAITGAGWEQQGDGWVWAIRLRQLGGDGWALAIVHQDEVDVEVMQGGGLLLWDDLQVAYMGWLLEGRPGRERFGMTVGPFGQHLWLDLPTAVTR